MPRCFGCSMRIVAFARDPGGANALIPIIKKLTLTGDRAELTAQDWALERFAEYGLTARPLILDEVFPLVQGSDVVLTATSWPPEAEWKLWQMAERVQVPTLAVMDFWSNFRSRFFGHTGEVSLPTRVAAMDRLAADSLRSDGVPPERIIITGQPFLEMRAQDLRAKAATHGSVEVGRILFASQPLSAYPGADSREYDEFSVVRLVFQAVEAAVRQIGVPLRLIIRPHPKDDRLRLRATIAEEARSSVACEFETENDLDESILRSQLVLGVNSMLLVEAALAGRPVISVQPGLPEPDNFPLSRIGCCPRVGTADGLKHAVIACLKSSSATQYEAFSRRHAGATARVMDSLRQLAGNRKVR